MNRIPLRVICIAMLLLTAAFAFGDDTNVKGMISGRAGDTVTVSTSGGGTQTVILTDTTRVKDNTGLFGLDRTEMAQTVLIPGLKVSVDGTPDAQGRVVAKTITVDGDDLETSEMIEAGLQPTAQQVAENMKTLEAHDDAIETNQQNIAANKAGLETAQKELAENQAKTEANIKDIEEHEQRFSALSDYDVKGQATLNFAVGSSTISAKDKAELKKLADEAKSLKGYIVEVTGFADSTGSAAMNTGLSEKRAKAVVTYLMQQGGIPARHIVAPGAMGEYGAAAPNETKAGRAANRRVEVKVLVNKGISGA
jgi:OmpA-OmpF porin, OOP family